MSEGKNGKKIKKAQWQHMYIFTVVFAFMKHYVLTWQSYQEKSVPSPNVDGLVDDRDKANHFATHYKKIYDGNDPNAESNLRNEFLSIQGFRIEMSAKES